MKDFLITNGIQILIMLGGVIAWYVDAQKRRVEIEKQKSELEEVDQDEFIHGSGFDEFEIFRKK